MIPCETSLSLSDVMLSRRTLLAGFAAALPAASLQAAEPLPMLRSGSGQFVEFEPAEPVPDFTLVRRDGRNIRLSSFRGTVLIVNFWASWCPPCRIELPLLEAFTRNSPPGGARAIAISVDRGGKAEVEPFLRSLNISRLPVFLDPDFEVATRAEVAGPSDPFRLFGLPLSYVLSPGGANLGYFRGLVDWMSPDSQAFLATAARRA